MLPVQDAVCPPLELRTKRPYPPKALNPLRRHYCREGGSGALVPLAAGPSALDRHRAGDGWWALRAYGCSSATAERRSPAGSASPRCPDPARGHLPAGLVAEPVYQPEEHVLELPRASIFELNEGFISLNGKLQDVAMPDFTIVQRGTATTYPSRTASVASK